MTLTQDPLVSCIMPTRDRPGFVPRAAAQFVRQTYANTELIVVDDGDDPIADLLPSDDRIRYLRVAAGMRVGPKRNFACELARGAIIAHWDDDDWYSSVRIARQVASLEEDAAALSGSSSAYFFDQEKRRAWHYAYSGNEPYLVGSTLAYRKSFWEAHRFPDVRVGEDIDFIGAAEPRMLRDLRDPALCVASIHAGNTSPRRTIGAYWRAVSIDDLRAHVGDEPFEAGGIDQRALANGGSVTAIHVSNVRAEP